MSDIDHVTYNFIKSAGAFLLSWLVAEVGVRPGERQLLEAVCCGHCGNVAMAPCVGRDAPRWIERGWRAYSAGGNRDRLYCPQCVPMIEKALKPEGAQT